MFSSSKGFSTMTAIVTIVILIGIGAGFILLQESNNREEKLKEMNRTKNEVSNSIKQSQRESSSDIAIEMGYSQKGYLVISLANHGSIDLPVEKDNQKKIETSTSEAELNWQYLEDSKKSKNDVMLSTASKLFINTTEKFPEQGEQIILTLKGPYDTGATLVCEGGSSTC